MRYVLKYTVPVVYTHVHVIIPSPLLQHPSQVEGKEGITLYDKYSKLGQCTEREMEDH